MQSNLVQAKLNGWSKLFAEVCKVGAPVNRGFFLDWRGAKFPGGALKWGRIASDQHFKTLDDLLFSALSSNVTALVFLRHHMFVFMHLTFSLLCIGFASSMVNEYYPCGRWIS